MTVWPGSMGKIDLKYYVLIKGRGYWRPTKRMKELGFSDIRCGPDGPPAWKIAADWNERWQRVRRGEEAAPASLPPQKLTREQTELARRYPRGSVGVGFQRFLCTDEWSSRALSPRTKVWWPAWFRIRAMWGDVDPNTITFEQMSLWRSTLERKHGRDVAHKTIKVWRALWTVMRGMKIARGTDPSAGVRNKKPKPRHARWSEGEAVRLVKAAWRHGYHGLACIIAVAWDTQFSPIDVRTLAARHRAVEGDRLLFDRQQEGRTKAGRPAIGTLSRRTERLVAAYQKKLGAELHPDAILFRNRSKAPYREDTLADDFAAVRAFVFPGDNRRLMDMRRSGTIEAIAGGADITIVAAKMANSLDRSSELHRTYAPVDLAAVRNADEARSKGRRKMRGAKPTDSSATG
jgi:hypothetical protein